jgi:glycosyltransferase involved in cell wall biosynthesis
MKILIINEDLELGGAESMAVELANTLTEDQSITVSFAAAMGPLCKRLNQEVSYYELPKYSLSTLIKIIKSLSMIIKNVKPDIIHSQAATMTVIAYLALKIARSKAINILTHHSRRFIKLPRPVAVYLLNTCADHVIAISESRFNELPQLGVNKDRMSLIPNFVDHEKINHTLSTYKKDVILEKLSVKSDSLIVTMIGRLKAEKRFDKFIKILATSSKDLQKPLVGLIIGDGPQRKQLEELAQKYSQDITILFLGYQNDVYQYLSITDVFLFPSEHPEVLPMVLIEALSAGIPVICSNIPGNRDIISDGYNGFVIDDSEDTYKHYLMKILDDRELSQKLSHNGHKTAHDKFDKKVVVQNIISLYKGLLSI